LEAKHIPSPLNTWKKISDQVEKEEKLKRQIQMARRKASNLEV